MQIKELNIDSIELIKSLFKNIFMDKPWNNDWSNEKQLYKYIKDLIGNSNSLTYGLLKNDKLIGISMGRVIHWWTGTQYHIEELCIQTIKQNQGLGTVFLNSIENLIKIKGIKSIFLQTERNVPAYKFYLKNEYIEMPDHISFYKNL